MAIIWQEGMAIREFSREFEWQIRDVGIYKEDANIHLVPILNWDTLNCLDIYVTMRGGDKIACLETIQEK